MKRYKKEIGVGAAGLGFAAGGPAAITGAVSTFGTASTGAAISGLTGAAANSATLAAIGGGSLATGGGGMALGTTVLLGVTGVGAVAAVGAVGYIGYKEAKRRGFI